MEERNPFFESVAMYLRKSRAEEGEDTDIVLERHRAQLTEYAVKYRVHVSKVYEEVVSGDSLFARPQMTELLQCVEQGKYTGVLCMDIDRLGRGNMREQGLILDTFKDAGAAIITPDKIYDLNDEMDETQTEYKTFFARQELKMIKKRLARGRTLTLERGGWIANPPFGYVRDHQGKIPTLAPNPDEAKYVQQIFEWYVSGTGFPTICHRLDSMGVKPHRGESFSRNSVRKIIQNPVYIGKVAWGQTHFVRPKRPGETTRTVYLPKSEWTLRDGLQPPLIDEVTFRRANEILTSRYHPPYRESGQIQNPLAGILFCRNCGHAMTRRPSSSKKCVVEILCPTPGCTKASPLHFVEDAVLEELKQKLSELELLESENTANGALQSKYSERDAVKLELARLKKQRGRLYDLLEQGVYTVEVFSEREKILSDRISAVQADLHQIEKDILLSKHHAEVLIPRIRSILQEYWGGSPAQKNMLLKRIIKRAIYFKAKNAGPQDFSLDIELRDVE